MGNSVDAYDEVADSAEINIHVQDGTGQIEVDAQGGSRILSDYVRGAAESHLIYAELKGKSESKLDKLKGLFGNSILNQSAEELLEASNHANELNQNYDVFDYARAFEDVLAEEKNRNFEGEKVQGYPDLMWDMGRYIGSSYDVGKELGIAKSPPSRIR